MRFAKSRLRNPSLAEDAVSETVLAALSSSCTFTSESQITAWLYGVLRHKLIDQLRVQGREVPASDLLDESGSLSIVAAGGSPWSCSDVLWHDPQHALRQREFVELVLRCCARLPTMQAQAFIMKEFHELDTVTICERLRVSESHLWVILHRARSRIRPLLRAQWQLTDE